MTIVQETNIYQEQYPLRTAKKCHQKPWRPVDGEEIRVFLAVAMAVGFHTTPEVKDNWSNNLLLQHPGIKKAMPRDRYIGISSRLHFYDNKADCDHKLRKLKPILNIMAKIFDEKMSPSSSTRVGSYFVNIFRQNGPDLA